MPVLQCPIDGCDWKSQDLDEAFAAALTTALQIHDRTVHPPLAQPATHKLKLDPPTIAAGCDPDQWWLSPDSGKCIKQGWRSQTMSCPLPFSTAVTPIFVQTLCVTFKNDSITWVKYQDFFGQSQRPSILCQYKATCKEIGCNHIFDYSDEIIKDNLVRGIADPEIMSDLLGDSKTDRTLEETVSFIAQKEQGKVTRSAVGDSASAMSATCNNQKRPQAAGAKCWACGGPAHGQRNDRKARSRYCRYCEAWTFTCAKCTVKGHYTKSCSKCTTCGVWGHRDASSRICAQGKGHRNQPNQGRSTKDTDQEQVGYIYEQLCTTSEQTNQASRLEHHIFDRHWVARPSKPHPMLLVNMTPLPEDHASFGHPMQDISKLKTITMSMVADTGCQSSIIPLQSANNLGITEKDLLPVKLVMRGAIKEDLGVIGAVAVSVTTKDSTSNAMSTRLLCYVSDTMERAFICREALISLGIIHTNFPNVSTVTSSNIAASMENSEEVTCSCPRRRPSPPPVPTTLPPGLKATEEQVESLKEWLLDYYGATTFNVCEHQPLPLMNCEPSQLHVDPNATR
ncbi:unnamed protein product [Mytilus coruscus]|uniref:CCHC-type domain-containing protein n=1 Tax=Mytilus coruscus TaxID=42192 RepID=A0A6J8AHN5_MYTCO|nr:unnamed protein product [Mytilus coruscus]